MDSSLHIIWEVGETTKKRRTLCVRGARVVFLGSCRRVQQPVECNDGSTTPWVSGWRCARGFVDGGWMAARFGAVAVVVEGRRKKGNGPVPTVRCLGRPVSVCVCLYVFLSGVVSVVHVWRERTRDSLFIFFFTSLFSLSPPPPPQSPHPYDTRRRWTPALFSSLPSQCTKGTPPPRTPRRGEKSSRDDTYFSFNIFVPPRRAVMHQHRYSVFDFYSFPNVGRDRVVVFPTKPLTTTSSGPSFTTLAGGRLFSLWVRAIIIFFLI